MYLLRLRVLVEAALIRIITPAIRQLTIMDIIFATTIASNDAQYDKQNDDDGQGQHHANEPSSIRQTLVAHHYRSLGAIRINFAGHTVRLIVSIDGYDTDLVNRIRFKTGQLLIVLGRLLLHFQKFGFTLNPVIDNDNRWMISK